MRSEPIPDRGSAAMRIGMILRGGSPLTLLVSPVVVKEMSERLCVKPALGGGGWSDAETVSAIYLLSYRDVASAALPS